MSGYTGPPGPEKGPPRLSTEATRKSTNDETNIIPSQKPGKPNISRVQREYRLICEVQAPIERIFWRLEQRKAYLTDRLANAGVSPFCRPRRHAPVKSREVRGA